MVYFFRIGDRIKIGYSGTPHGVKMRFGALTNMTPAEPTILGAIDGTLETERSWHKRWQHLRVHGEWFEASDELVNEIQKVAQPVAATKSTRLSFRCHEDLISGVDARRGQMPRERWLRNVVQAAVDEEHTVAPASPPSRSGPETSGVLRAEAFRRATQR